MKRQGLYLDIGHSSMKVLFEDRGLEIPLGRLPGGELSEGTREALRRELRGFLGPGRSPMRAYCAVPAQGVSLRFLSIPAASREETAKILALQLEKEFPLPTEQLAWGYKLDEPDGGAGDPTADAATAALGHPETGGVNGQGAGGSGRTNGNGAARRGKAPPREVMVAAVRREILDEYSKILAECGVRPLFSPGTLAAGSLCPRVPGRSSVLDLGRTHSELLNLEDGRPSSLRSLSWGSDAIDREIARRLEIDPAEAEKLKRSFEARGEEDPADPRELAVQQAIRAGIQPLVKMLRESWPSSRALPARQLFILGGGSRLSGLFHQLAVGLGEGVSLKPLSIEGGPGRSAPTLGLRLRDGAGNGASPLVLDYQEKASGWSKALPRISVRRWIAAAVVLAAASICLRYVGPFIGAQGLERDLARTQASFQAVPRVDRELQFLTQLKASQTPFIDVLAVISTSAPRGARISSITLNKKGEVTLQGNLGSFQEITEFRGKLIGSLWFTQVVLQDQTPTKDKSRMDFHITAQLKRDPAGGWPALQLPPVAPEPEPADDGPADEVVDNPPTPPSEAPPPGAPPPGAPPGGAPGAPAVTAEGAPAAPPGGIVKKPSRSGKVHVSSGAPGGATPAAESPPTEALQQKEIQLQALGGDSGTEMIFEGAEISTPEGK